MKEKWTFIIVVNSLIIDLFNSINIYKITDPDISGVITFSSIFSFKFFSNISSSSM